MTNNINNHSLSLGRELKRSFANMAGIKNRKQIPHSQINGTRARYLPEDRRPQRSIIASVGITHRITALETGQKGRNSRPITFQRPSSAETSIEPIKAVSDKKTIKTTINAGGSFIVMRRYTRRDSAGSRFCYEEKIMNEQTEKNTQPELPFVPALSVGATGLSNSKIPVVVPPVDAGGSDLVTQLKAENEQLKATIRDAEAHRQITGELGRVGARSPELLFEAVKSDLKFADDGSLTNAAAVVDRLRRDFPEQFGVVTPPASIDAGAGTAHIPRLSKDALAKMKPAEIAKLDWEEVKRTLRQ